MGKKALVVWGGWKGHEPKECADVLVPVMREQGFEVTVSDTLDAYADAAIMSDLSLIVPIWTMGQIEKEQVNGLLKAVEEGAGLAGFHGGMCDSFRNTVQYQLMTGGNWVAHPGGKIPEYQVNIVNPNHPTTEGISDFKVFDTEQYYLHTDPSNNVLATTTFSCPDAPTGDGTVMPVVWTRMYGAGRVFYSSLGHVAKDFEVPEVLEIQKRGMAWASR
jgi:type 1 glutamine amidotransferase